MSILDTTRVVAEPTAGAEEIITVSRRVFDRYSSDGGSPRTRGEHAVDPGPAVLAALVLGSRHVDQPAHAAADQVMAGWLAEVPAGWTHLGMFAGGLAGCHHGLRVASTARPALRRLAAAARGVLVRQCTAAVWRSANVDWSDYDLVIGPAGVLLALAADPDTERADLEPAVAQLAALCDRDDLDRFRVWRYYGERLSGWNYGRINTGVAHGVPGVALALCAFVDAHGLDERTASMLRRVADWLVAEAYTDSHGMITWSAAAREGGPASDDPGLRQAWCYGTPGVAWALWELGRVLHEPAAQQLALTAFSSFLALGGDTNANVSLREGLALCHGDAGLMVLCDAFARHAGLQAAGRHRDLLDSRLRTRLGECPEWAAVDPSLLSGPAGVLAALLTLRSGDRSWLAALGVR